MAGGTPLASAFIRVRPDMSQFRREAERGLDGAGEAPGRQFGEDFDDAARRSGDPEGLGEETGRRFGSGLADSLKVAAGVSIAKVGELAASKLSEGFASALDATASTAKFQAQLGLTADESKRIGGVAGKLFAGAYGDNMEEVNAAVTSVIQNMDGMRTAGSGALETMTARAITVGQVMDEDVSAVTKAASQLMRTGLAPDAATAFDIITKGAQNGANASGDLLDTFNEYGTQFRKMGISGAEATGILQQGLKGGARDADLVADAIKEFSIRVIAGGSATDKAFKSLGLSGKQMTADIAAGGPKADKALDTTFDKLRAVKNPVDQAAIATALFGTQAEDLGKALFAIDPSEAVKGLGDLKGATDRASDALGSTPQAKLTAFKNSLQTNITNVIANNVIPVLGNLSGAFTSIGGSGGGLAAAAVPLVGMGIAAKVTASAVGAVKTGINGVKTAANGIKAAAQGVGSLASGFRSADAASSAFSGRMGTIGGKLRTAFNGSISGIKTAGTAIASAGRAALTASVGFLRASVATARQGVASALAAARTIAYTVVQKGAAAASKAWAIAQLALNAIMSANPIALVVIAVAALVAAVVIAYKRSTTFKNIVDAAFRGIAAAGKFMWDKVLKPVFGFIAKWVGTILVVTFKTYWAIAKQVFAGISAAVKLAWDKVLGPIWRAIKAYVVGQLIPGFKLLLQIAKNVWSGIRNAISAGWNAISGYFSRLRSAIGLVGRAFGSGASAIRTAWDRIKAYTKAPVNFVIQTVYNRGIVGLWNKVMGWLHLPDSMRLGTVPALAAGGPMPVRPGVFNKPTAIVGEGNTNYPEYVIPTDPKYRSRASALWQAAGGQLQMLQLGGIIGSVKKIASKAIHIGKDALDLITNPGKIWDKLVSGLPSAKGLATSPFGTAISMIPKKILDPAKDFALKIFKAFSSGFGGGSTGVVKAARSQLGLPYSWGGGGLGGPSYGIGRGAHTFGFDCSGLTEYAWGKGGKIDIGGTTDPQAAGSHSIGGPRPGALGFVGNPIHHVMLGSDKPGYVIQAPHTGAFVEEVRRSSSNWRWPNAAKMAAGGILDLGRKFTEGKLTPEAMRALQLTGFAGSGPRSQSRKGVFDSGGFGMGFPFHAKKPEAVLTDQQWADIHKLAMTSGKSGHTFNITGLPDIPSDRQITNALERSSRLSGRW